MSSGSASTSNASGWEQPDFGGGFQQQIGGRWSLTANLAASHQTVAGGTWTPTGGISVARTFQNGSLAAGYTRTFSSQVFVSSGYIDQASISYNCRLGRKFGIGLGASDFRSIGGVNRQTGQYYNAGTYYPLRPNMNVNLNYGFTHQQSTQSLLYNGNTSVVSFGVVWVLGHSATK